MKGQRREDVLQVDGLRPCVNTLPARLDEENLRLLCLHVKLATVRARREKTSYGALLAARQSWETWYHHACRARSIRTGSVE